MNEDEPQHLEGHTQGCRNFYYEQRGLLEDFRQHFNQTEEVLDLREELSAEKSPSLSVSPPDVSLYGLEDIVTKLDKAVIRTNSVRPSVFPAGSVLGVVVGLMLLLVCITGLFIWRKKNNNNNGFQPANTSDSNTNSAPAPDHTDPHEDSNR
ncbi:hypothetical protein Q5P01_018709 [Channa striata]|uniref:Uncharacterized protein n=1 Tax=Channa striata TaxID=64152 RepID=A0AA88M772_CHASR|nr:hypothetical protein Q5P01_018709 [Channa striata]